MNQQNSSNEVEKHLKYFTDQELPIMVDQKIQAGLDKGQKRQKRWNLFKHSTLTAVAACILFVLSVNYIPGFSTFAGKVPGLDSIVERIKYDDGLKDAVENEYVQLIDKSVEKNGITFTVDHVIVDSSRLILFYTLETEEMKRELAVRRAAIKNEKGKKLSNFTGSYDGRLSMEDQELTGRIDFSWSNEVELSESLTLSFKIEEHDNENQVEGESIEEPFSVTFPIDTSEIGNSETLMVNQSESIAGQNIHFEKLVSYPTREVLYVKFDKENDMKFLNLHDLHLENGKGEVLSTKKGASFVSDDERKIYLTGSYFKNNEELYIVLTKASALDKGDQKLVVDLKEEKILKAPDDQVSLFEVNRNPKGFAEEDMALHFKVETNYEEENMNSFTLSSRFKDALGKRYSFGTQSSSADTYFIYLDDLDYNNPLTFDINQYPKYINGDIRIKVK